MSADRTALGDHFRAQAQQRRELAAATPDDPRHLRGADALDQLAATADREIQAQGFYACHLLRHHVDAGRFAWPDGQSGRAIANWGFDSPVAGPDAHEAFLGDLCDLATWDACRHIAAHEGDFDRREARTIAKRYGMSPERVHAALDLARHHRLFQVGIPHWHDLTEAMRQNLEELDGTWVAWPGQGDGQPVYVNNVGADTAVDAREIVGQIVLLDPDALGAGLFPRIFPP